MANPDALFYCAAVSIDLITGLARPSVCYVGLSVSPFVPYGFLTL